MSRAALALSDVACLRGGRILFRGVNLTLDAGASALLTGPNGVGKSSLLALLAGARKMQQGEIEVLGGDMRSARHRRAKAGRAVGGEFHSR